MRLFPLLMEVDKIDKNHVRQAIITLLKNQKEEDRLRKSAEIRDLLLNDPDFVNSKTVLFYASTAEEVETFDVMRESTARGKRIALPTVNQETREILPRLIFSLEEGLEYGPYNIQQPKKEFSQDIDLQEIDLVVVPAVAFDHQFHRLGRGGGYYDRFLKKFSHDVPFIGLAFDFQVLDSLPVDDHDLPVTRVITNLG